MNRTIQMQMKCPVLLLLTTVSWRLIATTQILYILYSDLENV